jgi:sarcosine oxidase subunit alpha
VSGRLDVRRLPAAARPPVGECVSFELDGAVYEGVLGEPVAAALWAKGVRDLGRSEADGMARGVFCAIGHCFECRLVVDGMPDRRACLEPVRAGLRLARQAAPSPLAPPDALGQGGPHA